LADDSWERGPVALKFQLGDIVFAKAVLSLFRRSARLDEHPLDDCDMPEPPPQLDGAHGYVVWSHPIAKKLPILRARSDAILYAPQQYRRFFVDLSGGFEGYMKTFSGKTRSGLRRKLRKFTEASGGIIDWKQYRTPDEVATFFSLAKSVSAKTYQERLLGVGLPADPTFIASACAMSKEDRVRAYLLFLHGKPIAYLYCPVSEQVVSYDRLGYNPAYASLSPGTVLQLLVLEALFSEEFTTFDFTEGEGQHKEMFSTGSRLCGDVFVVCRRLVPISIIVLHHAMNRASATAGVTLDRLHLKSRMRRLIRGQLTGPK
jgi:CelD/BcsL family acetyltransferase involved in cellulose biosynthesis